LKCPTTKKTLKIGKNGGKEDQIVSHVVDELSPNICQMQPITPTLFIDETIPRIDTQCAFEDPKIFKCSFPSYPLNPT
jgi:hypothetical protein